MDLSDLRTFLVVARTKGITAAGRELNTVASNVTTRIKNLEDELGVALFLRHSRGMQLSDAGLRLLPYAERLITLSREAQTAACDDGTPRGHLDIGSMETTAAIRLPELLARYHRACPQVRLALRTGPTAQLVEDVLGRTLDAAFVAGPLEHAGLQVYAAFEEELVLVSARELTSLAAVRRSAALGLTVLMFRAGCSYRQRLEQVLAALGMPSYTRLELGTLDGILGCVAAGMGITLLPRAVVAQSPHAKALSSHQLEAELGRSATLLVTRRDMVKSRAFEIFTDLVVGSGSAPARRGSASRGGSGRVRAQARRL